MATDSTGIIYILRNEAMPGYIKIGKTSLGLLEQRIRDLSNTSVPIPFTCFYAARVMNMHFVEKQLHDAFDNHRTNPKREFFQIAPERVVAALKLAELEDVTPKKEFVTTKEDSDALNEARERRSIFNFEMVDIPQNTELSFSRDESIKARVIDNRSVEFNGKVTSLSASAREILGYDYGVAGTDYWKYEGETLDERRRRFERGLNEPSPMELIQMDAEVDTYLQLQEDIARGK